MADLSGSPLCFNGMKLLMLARDDNGITLTKSGGLYRKCVEWAADEFCWPEHEPEKLFAANKVLNEQDFLPLAVMHDLMIVSRLMRHYKGKAMLTKAGRTIIGDCGSLQAVMFDAHFTGIDPSAYERFSIEYADADPRHYLGVVQNRLAEWATLADFASWCLPLDAIETWRISPQADACFHLLSRIIRPLLWLGMLERDPEQNRTLIEERRYRKTALFDRFLHIATREPDGRTIH